MTFLPGLLILCFVVFFCITFWHALKTRDDLFTVFYGFLFLYTIFTQIGYVFFPDVAADIQVYFGPHLFYPYWLFVFLSFSAVAASFFGLRYLSAKRFLAEGRPPRLIALPRYAFFPVVACYLGATAVLFIKNLQSIRYAYIEDAKVGFLLQLQPLFILTLYMKFRRACKTRLEKAICALLLAGALALFLAASIRAGQRLMGLALLVGFTSYELGPFMDGLKKRMGSILLVGGVAVLFLMLASRIVALREKYEGDVPIVALREVFADSGDHGDFDPRSLIRQDYFAPSTLLLVSMAYNWVDPGEVMKSNVFNYIPFTKYPYLQNLAIDLVKPAGFTRSESYGYYLLTEGYNFAGWVGIFYCAVIVHAGLGLWRLFAKSRDPNFDKCMMAMLCLLVIGVVRGPSVYFVRNVYLNIVPAWILISLALGYFPKPFSGRSGSP